MATNKEKYFYARKIKNKFLNESVIKELILSANGFETFSDLVVNFNNKIKDESYFDKCLKRVMDGEPIQYVLGYSYFLNLKLKVDNNVLIPRNETEELVVFAKKCIDEFYKDKEFSLVDVCTGSGCIALAFKDSYRDRIKVSASDISLNALQIAKENAKNLLLDIEFLCGDMCEPIIETKQKFDILISNPPYIRSKETIGEQVLKYEPHSALLASPVTKHYEAIFKNVKKIMNKNFMLFFEIGEDMEKELFELIGNTLENVSFSFHNDIYGKRRFLWIIGEGNE